MSHPELKLNASKRKQLIIEHVGNKSLNEIAELCGVDRRTIYRDIDKLKEDGKWYQWIEDRFIEILATGEVDDDKKLTELGKIYSKQFIDKHEVETKGDLTFTLNTWRDEKRLKSQSTTNPTLDNSPSMKTDTKLNTVDSSVEQDQEKPLPDAKKS